MQIHTQRDSLSHDDDVIRTNLFHLSETTTASGRSTGGYDSCNAPTNPTVCVCARAHVCVWVIVCCPCFHSHHSRINSHWTDGRPMLLPPKHSHAFSQKHTHTLCNSAQHGGNFSSRAVSSSLQTAWGLNMHNHTHTHPHTHGLKPVSADDDSDVRKALCLHSACLSLKHPCGCFVLEWLLSLYLQASHAQQGLYLELFVSLTSYAYLWL